MLTPSGGAADLSRDQPLVLPRGVLSWGLGVGLVPRRLDLGQQQWLARLQLLVPYSLALAPCQCCSQCQLLVTLGVLCGRHYLVVTACDRCHMLVT